MKIDDTIIFSKKLARLVGRAVAEFGMIGGGDRVLIGLSGGKDSLVLAAALARLRDRSPVPFELFAVSVDPTGGKLDFGAVGGFVRSLGIEHETITHPIFDIIEAHGTSSPCSFCANMRRGILARAANDRGCGTLALGHHLDDAIETLLLDLCWGGRVGCFAPSMTMDRSGVRVIRPLVLAREGMIAAQAERMAAPVLDMGCPHGASSKRAEAKRAVSMLSAMAPGFVENAAHALVTDVWKREARV